jgi:23S rRNA (adenine-N6)-dimethyltransferase
VLTDALARQAAAVLAVEIDDRLVPALARRYRDRHDVVVIEADALTIPLPASTFRVVANPPFNLTAPLLRRLVADLDSGLARADLIVQWQVARARVLADRGPCDLFGAMWGPWWEFRRGGRWPAKLFRPEPAVDAAVLVVERRQVPLLALADKEAYGVFLRRHFRPGQPLSDWIRGFCRPSTTA